MKQWWQARNPRERLMIVLCAGMIVFGAWIGMQPSDASGGKLLGSKEARAAYEAALRDRTRLDAETERLRAEVKRLSVQGGSDEALPDAIRKLQECASASKVHIREMKPLRTRKVGTLVRTPISIRFSSTRFTDEAVPFLYRIEDPAGKLVIEKLNVSSPDQRSGSVDVELQVALFAAGASAGSMEDPKSDR